MSMELVKQENMRKWLIIASVLTLIDQITKRIAEQSLQFAERVPAFPMFNFRLVYNEGAAFSFLSEAGGWQRWFFVILATAVCIYLIYWLRKIDAKERLLGLSLSFILSGALGNLIDRALYGKVTDFFDFYYRSQSHECIYFFFYLPENTCHWPTFNIADILISVGAALLFIQMIFEKEKNEADSD